MAGLHQNWNAVNSAPVNQGPVPQPVFQDRRPMENFQSQGPVIPQPYQDRMTAARNYQAQGPVQNPAYIRAMLDMQNSPVGVRPALPTLPHNYGQGPFILAGDGTGGEVSNNGLQPNYHPNDSTTGPFDKRGFSGSAPDGTDISQSWTARPAYLKIMMDMMQQAAAFRQQAAALRQQPTANLLQGLFGGTPYQGQIPAQPPDIRYTAQNAFTQQQQQFDQMMNTIAQNQMHPPPNMRAYRGSTFGGGQDWQNQFKDF